MAEEPEGGAGALLCAICFEAVDAGISLPCECKVDYCMQCWDKALAKSFNACAKARCPTCRTPVRVDFDAGTGRLTFEAEEEPEDIEATRVRISQQLRPAQVQLLQVFGAAQRPCSTDAEAAAQAAELTEAGSGPRCVCGGSLERVSIDERFRRFLNQADAWRHSARLASLLASGQMRIVCDLCDGAITREHQVVWVCERGSDTIRHATSNDVCARCLARYAWGISDEASASPPTQPAPTGSAQACEQAGEPKDAPGGDPPGAPAAPEPSAGACVEQPTNAAQATTDADG